MLDNEFYSDSVQYSTKMPDFCRVAATKPLGNIFWFNNKKKYWLDLIIRPVCPQEDSIRPPLHKKELKGEAVIEKRALKIIVSSFIATSCSLCIFMPLKHYVACSGYRTMAGTGM